jgi:2-keto-4-pentenoate hydratase
VVGFLTTATALEAGATHSLAGASNPGIEPELAIRFGSDVPADPAPEQVTDAIDAVAPALELVDLDRPLDDLHAILAGNVFHRGLLLGDFDAARVGGELDGLAVAVRRGGEEAGAVSIAESYRDLTETLRTVARRLGLMGEALRAGQFVIAGSLTPIVPVAAGDEVRADFGPLGTLVLDFTD